MFNAFLAIGLLGLSAMTWLFPVIARIYARRQGFLGKNNAQTDPISRIAIVIPAHNEVRTLPKTLPSIVASIEHLKKTHPGIQVDIRVGADGCSDHTAELARSFGAEVLESNPSRGKWKIVHEMIRASQNADWIVLADSGIIWPQNFLSECIPYCQQRGVIGVSPTYRNPSAGLVEKLIWNLECALKTLENAAGGPVSVHGPTVMYRQTELRTAFDALTSMGSTWINDDVAISLFLRLTRPNGRIVYIPSVGSWDCPEAHLEAATGAPIREFNRRKRMVLGNLQWMTAILKPNWHTNKVASLIALRRIFRMLWAYWIAACVLAVAWMLGISGFLILTVAGMIFGIIFLGKRPIQMLVDAGFVSLSAPYYLASGQNLMRWK